MLTFRFISFYNDGHFEELLQYQTLGRVYGILLKTFSTKFYIYFLYIHQGTHFLYSIENSPMDLSRKSQTSTNTSEFDRR